MNLLNRIVEFPDRFDLTIEDTSQKIQVDIFKDEQGDGNEGTVLNAENLTAAFEEKQDALIFGNGIDKNSSNRLTLVKNELICDYKILLDWIDRNVDRYRVIYLDYNYANSNYQTKDKTSKAEEVLIVNY